MDLPAGSIPGDPRGPVPSRGTYVGRLADAALMAPHAVPPSPTNPIPGGTLTPP